MDNSSTSNDTSQRKKCAVIYCFVFVPMCPSNSILFPDKVFLTVPQEPKLRKKWMKVARRQHLPSPKSVLRCCEDHFDKSVERSKFTKCRQITIIYNSGKVMSTDRREKEGRWCRNGCLDSCCCPEPFVKRTRMVLWKKTETAEVAEPTILDVLNEDCWRLVLQYLRVEVVVQTERVSKRWRQMVLRYWQGIRVCVRTSRYLLIESKPIVKCRTVRVLPSDYMNVINKFGSTIAAADCLNAKGLRYLHKKCPELEDLRIQEARFHNVKTLVVRFEKLKRLTFRDISHLEDTYVGKFLKVNTPEELVIVNNETITGRCLTKLKNNLRSLQLHSCEDLDIHWILRALDHLSEITELRMYHNPVRVLQDISKLIECTPKLEYLGLDWYNAQSEIDIDTGGLVKAICGLNGLTHLSLHSNDGVKDEWLKAIGQSCTELRVVHIGACKKVTAKGVSALCRGAGHRLFELDVSANDRITDNDVVSWISLCPKLEILDVCECGGLTDGLPAAARGAAPRRLRLRAHGTALQPDTRETADDHDIILDFTRRPRHFEEDFGRSFEA